MKRNIYLLVVAVIFFFSCNSSSDKKNDGTDTIKVENKEVADEVKCPTDLKLKVVGGKFSNDNFEIKKSWFELKDGGQNKQIYIVLQNYDRTEAAEAGGQKAGEVKLVVMLYLQDGSNFEKGIYKGKSDAKNFRVMAYLYTEEGKIFQNWGMNDPDIGQVEIFKLTDSEICGNINLSVQANKANPTEVTYNGNFSVSKK